MERELTGFEKRELYAMCGELDYLTFRCSVLANHFDLSDCESHTDKMLSVIDHLEAANRLLKEAQCPDTIKKEAEA